MFDKIIKNQAKTFIKPALQQITTNLKTYKDSIELESGEITVAGIILLENNKLKISICTMKKGITKMEVARHLKCWDVEELADILTKNIEKLDLSKITL
ncbi:hypothetical protein FACS1894153_0450 [Bacteroidia bacterium]|nr:hypothetical protein FACS1894153_0450 [Bacteroidia bacterium]